MSDSDLELNNILKKINELIPFYTPEWEFDNQKSDLGTALINIFAIMYQGARKRFGQVPAKNFIAFLEMIGIQLLPSESARVPVTFSLSSGATNPVLIPARTQVMANPTDGGKPVIFETEKNIMATPAKLMKIYATAPEKDEIFEHSSVLENGNSTIIFQEEAVNLQEHILYLANSEILNLKGKADIVVSFYATGINLTEKSLNDFISWKYWNEKTKEWALLEDWSYIISICEYNENEWKILKEESTHAPWNWWRKGCEGNLSNINDYGSQLKSEAKPVEKVITPKIRVQLVSITINKPDMEFTKTKVFGMENLWLCCEIKKGKLKESGLEKLRISHIRIVSKSSDTSCIDGLFYNDIPLKMPSPDEKDKWVYPFGKRPRIFDTFYIASNDAFSKKKALITLYISGSDIYYLDSLSVISIQGVGPIFKERLMKKKIDTVKKLIGTAVEDLADILSDSGHKVSWERAQNIKEAAEKKYYDKKLEYLNSIRDITSTPADDLTLSWEYWNGVSWQVLTGINDDIIDGGTNKFTISGKVNFKCPSDLAQTSVNGQKNYWIRVRITNGDYGKEQLKKSNDNPEMWEVDYSKINPPKLQNIKIEYSYEDSYEENVRDKLPKVEKCITYNNLRYLEVEQNKQFQPFEALEDTKPSIYMGFDRPPLKGPLSIFMNIVEQDFVTNKVPRFIWEYSRRTGEKECFGRVEALDGTNNFTSSGNIEFFGPSDFANMPIFGDILCWLRVVYMVEEMPKPITVKGIHLNTTWASQSETIRDEIIGSGNGEASQIFKLLKTPVISESIWVNEFNNLTEDERKDMIKDNSMEVTEVRDEKNVPKEFWVRWSAVDHFYESDSKARQYMIDRVFGQVRFGDGICGAVLPPGANNIRASYCTGGGAKGNVGVAEIVGMCSSLAFVNKVVNHTAAYGGTDIELIDQALVRGPKILKHGNRAVAAEDYEWLARQASCSLARVKCLPNCNGNNEFKKEPGWVTVIIVPESIDIKPLPDIQLKRKVKKYLQECAASVVTSRGQLVVRGPEYKEISITAVIYAKDFDLVPIVEMKVMEKLKAFLHPLRGGSEGKGWEFGRHPYLSDFYGLLEDIEGVDFVSELTVDEADIDDHVLIYSGVHNLTVLPPGGE